MPQKQDFHGKKFIYSLQHCLVWSEADVKTSNVLSAFRGRETSSSVSNLTGGVTTYILIRGGSTSFKGK